MRRQGQGVKTPGGNTSKLAPLSPKYIKARAADPNLHPDTSPSTSNLTRTGAMLDALTYVLTDSGVSVRIEDKKQLEKATYTNEARPWINFSKGEKTKIRDFVEKLLKDKR